VICAVAKPVFDTIGKPTGPSHISGKQREASQDRQDAGSGQDQHEDPCDNCQDPSSDSCDASHGLQPSGQFDIPLLGMTLI